MFTRMFMIENHKLSRRTMFWFELGAMLLAAIAILAFMLLVRQMLQNGISEGSNFRIEGIDLAQAEALLTWPMSFPLVLTVVRGLGMFLALILAGAVTAQEYTWRSYQLWLSRGVPRWQVLAAKFTAVAGAILCMVTLAVLVSGLITGVSSLSLLNTLPIDAISWLNLLLAVLTAVLTLLPYVALAMLLAVATRSTAVAVGAGLAFTALLEPLAAQFVPLLGERFADIAAYLPASLAQTLNGHATTLIAAGTSVEMTAVPTPAAAAALLAIYTLALLVTAMAIFQRQALGG